ncbi:hypothetical protein TNIN_214431 [Trichonephila inaurata madagascariensis]|uniref:Uncharacterized protein n=1 Tax=Trichonephila inaurata madagascariensis TaxID=2747483 RepID=A0A8X7CAY5_9ARAC|nr:hypothetical protein TNIN_214431 [Trichonephila inaurata madagascariensis]
MSTSYRTRPTKPKARDDLRSTELHSLQFFKLVGLERFDIRIQRLGGPKLYKSSTVTDPQPPTPVSEAKEKTKKQPSQTHGPRKDGKKTDLINVKPTTNLKKIPEKNIPLKIAREKVSLYESTPVSKRSRRRKTFQASDDMDTDANLSDTDYVTNLASKEYDSLLEADFK